MKKGCVEGVTDSYDEYELQARRSYYIRIGRNEYERVVSSEKRECSFRAAQVFPKKMGKHRCVYRGEMAVFFEEDTVFRRNFTKVMVDTHQSLLSLPLK